MRSPNMPRAAPLNAESGPPKSSCFAADGPANTKSPRSSQGLTAARRELRTASAKLAYFGAWHKTRCLCAAPVLLREILEQLWRAASTLGAEARR